MRRPHQVIDTSHLRFWDVSTYTMGTSQKPHWGVPTKQMTRPNFIVQVSICHIIVFQKGLRPYIYNKKPQVDKNTYWPLWILNNQLFVVLQSCGFATS